MGDIEKALQDLESAVNSNDSVKRIKVTVVLEKPKPSKAVKDSGATNT